MVRQDTVFTQGLRVYEARITTRLIVLHSGYVFLETNSHFHLWVAVMCEPIPVGV